MGSAHAFVLSATILCMVLALRAAGGDGFDRLGAAVDGVVGERIEQRSAGRLGEDLVAIRRQIDRLEAEFSRRLGRFETLGGHRADGAASVVAWLRERCGLSGGGASARVEVARQLAVLPDARDLFAAGAIGLDSAQLLAHTVSDVGCEAAAAAAPELTSAALTQDPDGLRLCSRQLRHQVDADGAAVAHEKLFERRSLSLTQGRGGGWWLEGLLDPEGGALVSTALDALMRPVPGEVRSSRQRRADALVELATRGAQSHALPRRGGQRPHLVLRTTLAALRGEPGEPAPELSKVGAIPLATAQRIACDAAVSEVVVSPEGQPLDAGRTRRTSSPAMRRAIVERDGGCIFPGCDRPPEWCDAHHLERDWCDGGETNVREMGLVCRTHHRMVHEGRWRLVRVADGSVSARPPP